MMSSKANIDVRLQKILILDFGSQYTQLIARRIREAGVYSEIYSCDADMEAIRAFNPSGIIFSGGPESVFIEDAPKAHDEIFELGTPILVINFIPRSPIQRKANLLLKILSTKFVDAAVIGTLGISLRLISREYGPQ